jgi:hypothetical protein
VTAYANKRTPSCKIICVVVCPEARVAEGSIQALRAGTKPQSAAVAVRPSPAAPLSPVAVPTLTPAALLLRVRRRCCLHRACLLCSCRGQTRPRPMILSTEPRKARFFSSVSLFRSLSQRNLWNFFHGAAFFGPVWSTKLQNSSRSHFGSATKPGRNMHVCCDRMYDLLSSHLANLRLRDLFKKTVPYCHVL